MTPKPRFERHPANPIVQPGRFPWRMAVTFNPGVIRDEGRFWLYERAAGGLRPFHCYIGLLRSDDGVRFEHVTDQPVFTPEMAGSRCGSVQDPRVVKIGARYYMTYAFRPYAWNCWPTGLGVPDAAQADYPGFDGNAEENQTRSGIAVSDDRVHWRHLSWVSHGQPDDRDVILFPEKIGGRYAVLRRPIGFVSTVAAHSDDRPCVRISYSDDLETWTEPEIVLRPAFAWENNRIGGSTPPIRIDEGWLIFYHGVETLDAATRRVCYRMGAFIADAGDPRRIVARCPDFLMEPEAYYEKAGLFIPNAIFPTAAVDVDGLLHVYYGACDTCIGLATAPLADVVRYVLETGRRGYV